MIIMTVRGTNALMEHAAYSVDGKQITLSEAINSKVKPVVGVCAGSHAIVEPL